MQILDRIVQMLQDGSWHEVSEIAEKLDLNGPKLKASLKFLKDYGFIHLSSKNAKLTVSMMKFLIGDRKS